ncbi:MAG: hypothetical protein V7704_08035 [Aurantimonas endophytica]|uniref:hypothetical protein n=1 Tax=Aurantimonas endophytica TaxID=1522175 RepID=UPI0030028463
MATTGVYEPTLHVIIGLMIFLAALAAWRSPCIALLIVLAVQCLNELNDFYVKDHPPMTLVAQSIEDTGYTMALPLLIGCCLLAFGRLKAQK